MCGICGIFDLDARPANADLVRRMAGALAHRGPDNDGFYDSPLCRLGHRRLRIIDLSPLGHQPMTNEDDSLWVSFNGEIYNYLDLRPELVRRGHQFRSQSDTEVILHLYEEKGDAFLRELNGMFAIALWDARRERLLLARDRFGKKPIYYWMDGKRLLFGSELKALLADPAVPRELNPHALSAYLSLGYVPCPATIFRGVYKLPPASWMVAERDPAGNGLRLRGPERYWELRYAPDARLTEADCTARIREIVRDAVRIRMFSDVPLGAFLSGGLDSSTVVAAMAEVSDRPVETFSIGFDDASFDELPYAETVAKKFRTNHHTFRCTPDALEVLPILVHHYDEPFADSSAIPTYYVSKIARQLVTVALSGDGGDETFAGYTRYDLALDAEAKRRALSDSVWRAAFGTVAAAWPKNLRGWGYFYRNSLTPLGAYAASMAFYQPPEKESLWTAKFRARLCGGNAQDAAALYAEWARKAAGGDGADLLSQIQFVDQMLYLPDDILVKVDRASMAVALESRAPLLDYRLAEFMATVPAALRYKNREKKYLLKKAVTGILPDEIISRSKKGFSVPLATWFRGAGRDFVRETLTGHRTRERGIFDTAELDRLLSKQDDGRRVAAEKLWALVFFELWCRHWLDEPVAAETALRPQAAGVV
ncbi:MAG: asparagine synthase (glutamine-hydrolyzing) [Acidobacteria bacterium]|nr:asparagine synthase (glutamine-hydrolyzing) [Acidobacteriota bacterium]MBI3661931.1 asparagine synthase (glutamine-hydrolyzing) [Acidobacteriota bacterium]